MYNAVYANVGYSPYDQLAADKISFAIGYKHSF